MSIGASEETGQQRGLTPFLLFHLDSLMSSDPYTQPAPPEGSSCESLEIRFAEWRRLGPICAPEIATLQRPQPELG
jgi:hypothetical protein